MMPNLGHEANSPALYGVLEFYRRVIKVCIEGPHPEKTSLWGFPTK